jgi:hypothetical protein
MKHLKVYVILGIFCLSAAWTLQAQSTGTLPNEIIQATRDGDAFDLSKFFNTKIELVLPSNSGVYSKEQAQFMMKQFFSTYPPVSFQIIHQGIRENATFAIGKYTHSKGQFRILFLAKTENDKTLIHQLRIELQDE